VPRGAALDESRQIRATPRSKDDFTAQLQLSIEVCLTTANLPEALSNIVHIPVGLAKDRMIQEVERFGTELELLLVPDGE
jgi:hypothetical protein